jgi:hypothetical protein
MPTASWTCWTKQRLGRWGGVPGQLQYIGREACLSSILASSCTRAARWSPSLLFHQYPPQLRAQVLATDPVEVLEDITVPKRESDITAWVNVIYGCNEKCTYCVVPFTR